MQNLKKIIKNIITKNNCCDQSIDICSHLSTDESKKKSISKFTNQRQKGYRLKRFPGLQIDLEIYRCIN